MPDAYYPVAEPIATAPQPTDPTVCPVCETQASTSESVECTISTLNLEFGVESLNTELIALLFGGALLLWVSGLGVGLLIQTIRRFKL